MSSFRISQLARRSGVPSTTLRYYDAAGLLPAQRTESGYRMYEEQAIERLAFIGAAKRMGLALDEIGELLSVWEHGTCSGVRSQLRPLIDAQIVEAERRIVELQEFTTQLRTSLAHLDALPDRDTSCDPGCAFLELRRSADDEVSDQEAGR